MLELDLNSLKKQQFSNLIQYIYERCDKFSMAIPNFEQEQDIECAEWGWCDEIEMNEKYIQYLENIEYIINDIEPYLIKSYTTSNYLISTYGYVLQVKIVKLYEKFRTFLLENGNFYNWLYPNLPEDLCFFSGEKCWMLTISHENICYIYEETKEDIEMLEKNNILYHKCINLGDGSAPTYKE